jgi:HAD superfamily hydrolase (TIGR01490 family)
VEAAFFDLDKTVIARASMLAFSRPLRQEGMISRRMLVRALWGQIIYVQLGASEHKLTKARESVLALTRGWDQARISAIVRDTLETVVEPIVFREAVELIEEHRAAGRKLFVVSAAPEEIVAPIAQKLKFDEAIATRARVDDEGRYTGEVELYAYGPAKADAMRDVAERQGIDLAASYAYSDSATDLPMLEAVGHAVVVNPDRALLKAARERGWEIREFTNPVRLRDRVPMPAPGPTAAAGGVVLSAAGAAAIVWWLRSRRPPLPPPASPGRWQELADRLHLPALALPDSWSIRLPEPSWPRLRRGR